MLRQQDTIFRKNRRGGVSIIKREHYLRDDLPCGVIDCKSCSHVHQNDDRSVLKTEEPISILDTEILINQIDLLKNDELTNCVILESSLEALERLPSSHVYREVRELINDVGKRRRLFVFSNEHHHETHVERLAGESLSQRDARASQAAHVWYCQHLQGLRVELVKDVNAWAKSPSASIQQSIAWIESDDEGKRLFPAHMEREVMEEGIAEGVLRECRVYDTIVDVRTGKQVEIRNMNRALLGDKVCVNQEGDVVGVMNRRNNKVWVGRLVDKGLFQAVDGTKVQLRGGKEGRRLAVSVDCWPAHCKYPLGHVVRDLGGLNDLKVEADAILAQYDVRADDWEPAVVAELPPNDTVPQMEDGRTDLRHLVVCSVDPPGCTDIDDALHCRKLDDNTWEVGVHIADVSHYVKEGSKTDTEASKRGTTVYLVDRRVDMLPALLSGNLCSLMSNVDRYAFSVIWHLDKQARIKKTFFHKSIIRSCNSFTYAMAQELINKKSDNSPVAESLRGLQKMSELLKSRRMECGALVLSSPTVKFVHSENGGQDVLDVEMYESLDTNSMVEEFMLLANITVANKIWSHFPAIAMLRRHPEPDPGRWETLMQHLATVGVVPASKSSKDVSDALKTAPEQCRVLVTRHMQQAVYFCSGTLPISDYKVSKRSPFFSFSF